jgi:hypothetical protein
MTKEEWLDELDTAIASAGLPWRVFTAWVEQDSPMCFAELTHDEKQRNTRRVSLARDRFPTVAERRAEILRQLGEDGKGATRIVGG